MASWRKLIGALKCFGYEKWLNSSFKSIRAIAGGRISASSQPPPCRSDATVYADHAQVEFDVRGRPYHHRSFFLETVALKPYRFLGAAIAALLASLSVAPAVAGPIQPFLDQLVKKEKLPGSVLLISGPQGRQIAVSGVANLKTKEPVTADTRFYPSCAKSPILQGGDAERGHRRCPLALSISQTDD